MNIIHIMTDHQRADSLGMVQCGIEVTPNLNRLMEESYQFSTCYNASPLCVPARTALATGVAPLDSGVVYNDWAGDTASEQKTIHKYLKEANYDVAHIGVHHIRVLPPLVEDVKFDYWIGNSEYEQWAQVNGIDMTPDERNKTKCLILEKEGEIVERKYSNSRKSLFPYNENCFMDNWFVDRAIDYIDSEKENPFAMFLNLWAPHPPLIVPEPYFSMFPPADITLPANVGIPASNEPPKRREAVPAILAENRSEEDWREAWSAHLGLVHMADKAIGRVIQSLKDRGLWDSTAILFTSDHGDHLGQHKMYQKMELYEQAVRVPFILKIPGYPSGKSDIPVSHLDVVPTILDLISTSTTGQPLEGRSLLGTITGTEPIDHSPIFLQFSGISWYGQIRRAVVYKGYKYIYTPNDIEELFHLEEDPLEQNNLIYNKEYKLQLEYMRGVYRKKRTLMGGEN
ncbi:MAG: sulfatase-like hydrolase/transferase [Spirochaetaceae bacterium]